MILSNIEVFSELRHLQMYMNGVLLKSGSALLMSDFSWAGSNPTEDALDQLQRLTLQSRPESDGAITSTIPTEEMSTPVDKPHPSGASQPVGNRWVSVLWIVIV